MGGQEHSRLRVREGWWEHLEFSHVDDRDEGRDSLE